MSKNKTVPNAETNAHIADEDEIRNLLTGAGPRPEVPPEDLRLIRSTARAEWERLVETEQERRRRLQVRGLLALAASLILAFLVGWWWRAGSGTVGAEVLATVEVLTGEVRGGQAELSVGDDVSAGAVLETASTRAGAVALMALRLTDGHSVRLDADSKVRLVSSQLIELERGAVYLDSGSAYHEGGDVEVLTPFGIIREIGTQYEVRLENGEGQSVRVRVRDGAISLSRGKETYQAVRGEELTLRNEGAVSRAWVEPYGPAWAWVQAAAPGFDSEGQSLQSYLGWVSRETGWQIRYGDETLEVSAREIDIVGSIDGHTPVDSLSLVLPASNLDYRIEDGLLVITRK